MKQRLIFILIVALMLMIVVPASAQASSGRPALYVERVSAAGRSGEVLFVGEGGWLTSVPVPASLYPPGYPFTIGLSDIALSKDGTKLAAVFYEQSTGNALQAVVADLALGSCCITLAPPLAQVYAYDLAGFSPDHTQIALSFAGAAPGDDFAYVGGMAAYDVTSGALMQVTNMEAPMDALDGGGSAIWALMGDWTESGVQWAPNCYACEGVFQGEYSLWLPQMNNFIAHSGTFFSWFGDFLAATGELLYARQIESFPISPEISMLTIPNVIQYVPGGRFAPFETLAGAPVVFFDAATLDLSGGAHWVANGSAFLVTPTDWPQWTLRNRDGATQSISVAPGARFVAGTADGWLAAVPGGSTIDLVNYVVLAGAFGAVIDRTQPRDDHFPAYRALYAPPLGAGITPIAPPAIAPPAGGAILAPPVIDPGSAPVQCAGFLPSRLAPGQLARVTPGTPNNLRTLPNVSADIIGRIPGGAEFTVIEGPVCDPAGLAWWQVSYSGLIGWTVEGQGGEYYTEPLSAG